MIRQEEQRHSENLSREADSIGQIKSERKEEYWKAQRMVVFGKNEPVLIEKLVPNRN